jgi:hypothetical protein
MLTQCVRLSNPRFQIVKEIKKEECAPAFALQHRRGTPNVTVHGNRQGEDASMRPLVGIIHNYRGVRVDGSVFFECNVNAKKYTIHIIIKN